MEAVLWKQGERGCVRCVACMHACLLADGHAGRCGVRANRAGTLRSLVSGGIASAHADPVEKKPLYHYLPGTGTFSFGTQGCNFTCAFCQNADISQPPRLTGRIRQQNATPEDLLKAALANRCASVAFTYNEPTVFVELMLATAALAREAGLGAVMVSNGFQTPQALACLRPLIQAANIDLKSMNPVFYRDVCGAALRPVLNNLARMRRFGWWIEVTTLLIPGLNDDPEELRRIAGFIAAELGTDVPWHVSAFHPAFNMTDRPPTPPATVDMAWNIGRESGLRFVYPGNVLPARLRATRSTLCPVCGAVCVDRSRAPSPFSGSCPACRTGIPGIWSPT
jgi:pyruvate formate lyase activating enzyme